MIYFLYGENSYELQRAVKAIAAQFDGDVERYDGESLTVASLPDLLMGGTLFASKRLVIIRYLSENKTVWDVLPDWLERIDDDVTLVLVEAKPDKRTKTYKTLQKAAQSKEFTPWKEYDTRSAENWVRDEAAKRGITLDGKMVQLVVARSGTDQWRLHNDLEKLSVLDEVTAEAIEDVIALHPSENVFALFETALKGDSKAVSNLLLHLQTSEDPHKVFGLLSGQVFQLAALVHSDKPTPDIAKDIGVHPFALSNLAKSGRRKTPAQVRVIVAAFARSDEMMKTQSLDPWIAVERALLATAQA